VSVPVLESTPLSRHGVCSQVLVFLANGGTRRQVYVAKTLIPRGTEIVHAYVHANDPEVGRWVAPKAGRLEYRCRATDAVIKLRQGREEDGQEMPQKPGCAFCARIWRQPVGTAEA
jgi:hypothetical protein